MYSPASLAITSAQLYAQSRNPRDAFVALDSMGRGRLALEEMRLGLKALGVHVTTTEARGLAQYLDGGHSPLGAVTFDYEAFLAAVGATQARGEAPAGSGVSEAFPEARDLSALLSPAALGITPAQLFSRSKSPRDVFLALDQDGMGRLSLEDARAALKVLGIQVNISEARSLAQYLGGSRSPLHAVLFDYEAFLGALGVTTRGEIPAPPERGASMPASAREVTEQQGARLVQERGGAREGYEAALLTEPPALSPRSSSVLRGSQSMVSVQARSSEVSDLGGLNSFLSEECAPPLHGLRNMRTSPTCLHTTGELATRGIVAFSGDCSAPLYPNAPARKPDPLQAGMLDKGGIGAFVIEGAAEGGGRRRMGFPGSQLATTFKLEES